jgi:hypothetical protein
MAYEFLYKVTLSITHRNRPAAEIGAMLPKLAATKAVTVGDSVPLPSRPDRKAKITVWDSRLHADEMLHSESRPLQDFFKGACELLTPYRQVFEELQQSGEASLILSMFNKPGSSHSVWCLSSDCLHAIASTGLPLYLEYYHVED